MNLKVVGNKWDEYLQLVKNDVAANEALDNLGLKR
jgi:DNA-directed RNA polymerase subunit N (RpoN/RPB10)